MDRSLGLNGKEKSELSTTIGLSPLLPDCRYNVTSHLTLLSPGSACHYGLHPPIKSQNNSPVLKLFYQVFYYKNEKSI